MRYVSSIMALHSALASATMKDLPDIPYGKSGTRRPTDDDVTISMFDQTWGSTALGYGGVGGSAMTNAYTVVINYDDIYCVYFGGQGLAYMIDLRKCSIDGSNKFKQDLHDHNMADCMKAYSRYK